MDDKTANRLEIRVQAKTPLQLAIVMGCWSLFTLYAAEQATSGFLPEAVADGIFPSRGWRDRLTASVGGLPPVLHTVGDDCECLKGHAWPAWAAYAVHGYLHSNPSGEEADVHKAKRAELGDSDLRAQVFFRDGLLCRYCGWRCNRADKRSDRAPEMDHVDPAVANGLANLVTACRTCNRKKGKRTPEAAGMVLRPLAGQRSDQPSDQVDRHQMISGKINGPNYPGTGRDGTGGPAPAREGPSPADGDGPGTSDPQPGTAEHENDSHSADGERPAGKSGQVGPASTARTSANPDPLNRPDSPGRARSEHFAGLGPVSADD